MPRAYSVTCRLDAYSHAIIIADNADEALAIARGHRGQRSYDVCWDAAEVDWDSSTDFEVEDDDDQDDDDVLVDPPS